MPHLSRSAFHHSGQGSPMGGQGLPQFVNHRVPSFVCHQALSSRGPPQWPEMRQFGKATAAGSSWGAERSFERLVFMTAVQPSCGPLSQRKLTLYSQLASRARKGTLTSLLESALLCSPSKARGLSSPRGSGELMVESFLGLSHPWGTGAPQWMPSKPKRGLENVSF